MKNILNSTTTVNTINLPPLGNLGFGIGLRHQHYNYILTNKPAVDWFEIISENYFVAGGKALYYLDQIAELYPLVMHGVSLNIGSTDPINFDYLQQLHCLIKRIKPRWVSDHLCWTGVNNINTHDLLPLPYNAEVIEHVVTRVKIVQDYLQRQILLENPSTYLEFNESTIPEWECISTIAEQADCLLLLDINNIYVNSFNHGFDPQQYLVNIPKHRVQQFHLAGHTNYGDHIIDTHDAQIIDPVWQLYRHACQLFPNVATLIERDDNIPEFPELYNELVRAQQFASSINDKSNTKLTPIAIRELFHST